MIASEFLIGQFAEGIIVRIVGRGTLQNSPAFRAVVEQSPRARVVVFDATACDYVDSTFLGCLIWTKKACETRPVRRFVIAASPSTRIKLFSTSSLAQYFDFVDACPEPLGELVKIDPQKLDLEALGQHVMRCHELLADLGGDQADAFRHVADRLAVELGNRAQARSAGE
ncbi:MAG: STAS domain-containing protein [Pirellulales bacterium]|nr:STAS domain-containing protein [Pirellulales bacterium]